MNAPAPDLRRFADRPTSPPARVRALAIGCSTGGPDALAAVLAGWSARGATQPIFLTQHMPAAFINAFATRLGAVAGAPAAPAVDGEPVRDGRIYVAPGDRHLLVAVGAGGPQIRLDAGPATNFCRPAVDAMFHSLAATYGAGLLAVVLTGMGRDGRDGAASVKAAGGRVIVQDEATSVVWGMPGAIVDAGLADAALPLDQIGKRLALFAKGKTDR